MSSDLVPRFLIIGDRPVKAESDDKGDTWIWAWDWDKRVFVKSPEYFQQVFFPTGADVVMLAEEDFQERVDDLLFA